ncbi:MAG: hypothetical protein GY835_09980, partial [bacterium]|nr:hypothetical protein [bacterium]
MPRKARGSVIKGGDESADEYQSLCHRIEALKSHRSTDIMCALDMELFARPDLTIRRMGATTTVAETTINNWITGRSSPTWESLTGLAEGLHPGGVLSDPLAWLQAGREHLQRLTDRRDKIALERRNAAVTAELRQQLDSTSTAEAILEVVRHYPEPVLRKFIELVSSA